MDTTVPRKAVSAVALILVLLAGLGVYQGWRRSSAGDQEGEGGLPTLTSPVTGAKTASALTDAPAPVLTEAQVREIARQEARAALGKPASTPASSDGDEVVPTGPKPATAVAAAGTTPVRTAPDRPALQTPAVPAPAEPEKPAPLF